MEIDGLYNESNSTYCLNVSDYLQPITNLELKSLMIFSIISVPLLLVPTLILQLFFIYRYKSTFLHGQFLYTTVVIILLNATYIAYSSTLDDHGGCLSFFLYMYNYIELVLVVCADDASNNHSPSTIVQTLQAHRNKNHATTTDTLLQYSSTPVA